MYNFYTIIFSILFCASTFAQSLTILSREKAEKIAAERKYNEAETEQFVRVAMKHGVVLNAPAQRFKSNTVSSVATNMDFEQGNYSGWTGNYTTYNCTAPTPNIANVSGFNFSAINNISDQHGICTTGKDTSTKEVVLPCVSPYGGLVSARIGDVYDGCGSSYIQQTFTVTPSQGQIIIHYALVLYDGHVVADAPKFRYRVMDSAMNVVHTVYWDATLGSGGTNNFGLCDSTNSLLYYRPWASDTFSLVNYIGQPITVEVVTSDCNGGAHRGYAYVDFDLQSGPLSTPGISGMNDFRIWPNPAVNSFAIESNSAETEFYLTDLFGKEMKSFHYSGGTLEVDVSDLPTGAYFLHKVDPKKGTSAMKLIIQH